MADDRCEEERDYAFRELNTKIREHQDALAKFRDQRDKLEVAHDKIDRLREAALPFAAMAKSMEKRGMMKDSPLCDNLRRLCAVLEDTDV